MADARKVPALVDDGGPAFPGWREGQNGIPRPRPGLSRRDYFAALAMTRLLPERILPQDEGLITAPNIAQAAYVMADAMISASGATSLLSPEQRRDLEAKLDQLADDRALFCRAQLRKVARWEFFSDTKENRGEVCVGGIRYSTKLDDEDCPILHPDVRAALQQALLNVGNTERRR